MFLGLSLALTSNTPPTSSGGDVTPDWFADFRNAAYTINGGSVAVGAIFEQNTDWGSWDSSTDIVEDVGFTNPTGSSGPVVVAALKADMLADGFTLVINYETSGAEPDVADGVVSVNVIDLPDYDQMYRWAVDAGDAMCAADGAPTTGAGSLNNTPHCIALSYDPAGKKALISLDGATALQDVGSTEIITTDIGIGVYKATIFDVAKYTLKSAEELALLSALT